MHAVSSPSCFKTSRMVSKSASLGAFSSTIGSLEEVNGFQKRSKDIKRGQMISKEVRRYQKRSKDIKRGQRISKEVEGYQKRSKDIKRGQRLSK